MIELALVVIAGMLILLGCYFLVGGPVTMIVAGILMLWVLWMYPSDGKVNIGE